MKNLFAVGVMLALPRVLQAHETWAPHTHTVDSHYSDLFVLCMAGLVVLMAGLTTSALQFKSRRSKASRLPSNGRRS